jgi:YbbR domain-containing protein
VSWITDDWRLKLLALLLAVLMLGAVAFSQNPPTTKTLQVPLRYTPVGENRDLVIIDPPASVNVTFSGLADVISNASANNFSATVDANQATPGPAVKLNIAVTSTLNVSIQNPAPIVVKVENLGAKDLPVKVIAHGATGWTVTNAVATPPTVHFLGPQSWLDGLTATIVVSGLIAGETSLRNQPIQLQNGNGTVSTSPCTTQPCASIDALSADVTITAVTGTSSATVPLVDAPPTNGPPSGFRITGISISPATIIVTGDPAAIAKVQRIILPGVDLSGATTTVDVQVNIPFPNGVSPLNGVQKATITYTIQPNPAVSPSPA